MKKWMKRAVVAVGCAALMVTVAVSAAGLYLVLSERAERWNEEAAEEAVELVQEATEPPSLSAEERMAAVVAVCTAENGVSAADAPRGTCGSGVFVSSDGYVLTTAQLVSARPGRVAITLASGEVMEGTTVWAAKEVDLALVEVKGSAFPTAILGGAQKVGDRAFVVGALSDMPSMRTLANAHVAATGYTISRDSDLCCNLMLLDRAVGEDGVGSVVQNEAGEVTALLSGVIGDGRYGVPASLCLPVLERLRTVGVFETPYLGLSAYNAAQARYYLGEEDIEHGLYVTELDLSGPAFGAGLRRGDVIIALNGAEVDSMNDFYGALFARQSGELMRITFLRDGSRREIDVVLRAEKRADSPAEVVESTTVREETTEKTLY